MMVILTYEEKNFTVTLENEDYTVLVAHDYNIDASSIEVINSEEYTITNEQLINSIKKEIINAGYAI